mgnify:CR=1 FL=1|jgi:hypothetical protein
MAREITLNLKISTLKGDLNHTENAGTLFVDLTGTTAVGGAATVTTTAAALTMGSVSSAGYAYFRNTGPTNFVEIGTGTSPFVPFLKLKAGEAAICRLGTNAPTARANTASVSLQYYILAD